MAFQNRNDVLVTSGLAFVLRWFLETMHQRCFYKVLADVGYANDRKLCIHKKRVCDVALACRRVGSKRVKVLYYFTTVCYDNLSAYRQEVMLQRSTFLLNAYIYICIYIYIYMLLLL